MRSGRHGRGTLEPEVTRISTRGIWLRVDDHEHFLSFRQFPWFRYATIQQIHGVRRPRPDHLRWAAIDVDLHLDSIIHPERYPLRSRQIINGVVVPRSRPSTSQPMRAPSRRTRVG